MRLGTALFALAAAVIVAAWSGSAPGRMPQSPLRAGEKLYCVSYAPFRGDQTPLDRPADRAAQIEEDLAAAQPDHRLRPHLFDRSRPRPDPGDRPTHGLKVLQGFWLSSQPDQDRKQIDTAVALAKRYPDIIRAVVVGNEVLLRGEMSAADLARTIREVKARVTGAGDLCRRLGILAAQPRGGGGGRFHHHPYPALLGGLPDPGRAGGAPMSTRSAQMVGGLPGQGDPDRRNRLAERRADARGRVAVAGQPGARDPGRAGAGQARAASAST